MKEMKPSERNTFVVHSLQHKVYTIVLEEKSNKQIEKKYMEWVIGLD